MAAGWTNLGSLADSLDTIVASARSTYEYKGVVPNLVDKKDLDSNSGDTWKEVLFAQISAQAVTENTRNENPQQYTDSAITITPQMVQISTVVTDKVYRNLSKQSIAQMGRLPGEAMARKEDEDGLTAMDASTLMGATGTPVQTADVAAAKAIISSNATEPGPSPYSGVFHGFCIQDFYTELVSGIGTYPIPAGASAEVFSNGFHLPIANVSIFEDGNIPIITGDDAKNFVFSKMAWVLVRDLVIKRETERKPGWGGGADVVFLTASYAYGLRSANWTREIIGDATAPA
jgi:hypothetical protein